LPFYGSNRHFFFDLEFEEALSAAEQAAAEHVARTGELPRYDALASILTSDVDGRKTVQQLIDEEILALAQSRLSAALTRLIGTIYRPMLAKEIDISPEQFHEIKSELARAYRLALRGAAGWIDSPDEPLARLLEAVRPFGIPEVDALLRNALAECRKQKAEAEERSRRASRCDLPQLPVVSKPGTDGLPEPFKATAFRG
jgi:hypothetical protein